MRDKLKQFVAAKRGVSPVIGVVLMVAVVVILAAVIGAFVLGLGGNQQSTPQASFSYDAQAGTLTMSSGDPIDPANLYYTVDGDARTNWPGASASGDNGNVVAGDSVDADATQSIDVIYDDGSGNTATLTSINVGNGGADGGA